MRLACIVIAAMGLLAAGLQSRQRSEAFVSAASSLTNVLTAAAEVYEADTGDRVVLNFGASNTLARQIAAGARVDLFVSADEAQMVRVAAQIVSGTRVGLVGNALAIAVPDDRFGVVRSPGDLAGPQVKRIAVGDPGSVPAGVYARRYLQRIGLWASVQPKLVPLGSVRLALAAVANGAVDAAIVYRTDIRNVSRVLEAYAVPREHAPAIVYPAAVLASGRNPLAACRFLEFLVGPVGAAIFERAGFSRVGG
jgi:molybdate transport system substrate-binding protein